MSAYASGRIIVAMTQDDIRRYYEESWGKALENAAGVDQLAYSNPVEDAVLYPLYESMLNGLGVRVNGGRVLDVGSGSGRWVRFFLERFRPERFIGVDFTASAVGLLKKWHGGRAGVDFRVADITERGLDLGERFDLINVANVLFHIPEDDRFIRSLENLREHVAVGGRIVTTEYLPRTSRRSEWMMVRSRYEFEMAVRAAGLKIVEVQGSVFFANDPLGIDGADDGIRRHFNMVRARMKSLLESCGNEQTRRVIVELFVDVERAAMAYCGERLSAIEFPSQKLVVMARAG